MPMTTEPLITCPNCGTEIELTEALTAPLHAQLERLDAPQRQPCIERPRYGARGVLVKIDRIE